MKKLNTHVYDVEAKPVNMHVETENNHKYVEDGKITVGNKIRVTDSIDTKAAVETTPDGKIKPYGLDADGAYDVEVKEKVADSVVDKHIDTAIKKTTPKPKKQKNGVHH